MSAKRVIVESATYCKGGQNDPQPSKRPKPPKGSGKSRKPKRNEVWGEPDKPRTWLIVEAIEGIDIYYRDCFSDYQRHCYLQDWPTVVRNLTNVTAVLRAGMEAGQDNRS